MKSLRAIAIIAICVLCATTVAGAKHVTPTKENTGKFIDFDRPEGVIKPVNGVGQPPVLSYGNTSNFHYLKEANVPYSRLHDVGGAFGDNIYVDIPNLFKDFDADETLPESYDFTFTDSLMVGLVRNGVEPYFRLGVTIENAAPIKAYRIYPPKDYAKWARICEHVILHYNYGWADGYHMDVSHWEIWNEPENYEDPMENNMWRGTFEQYMDLYATAAPYLKQKFPDLMIGGYGSCGFYAITGEGVKAANSSPRFGYFVDCFIKFMERARKEKWPLDFFSCHSYASPAQALSQFSYARKTLDAYGFKNTELSVNEWLPEPDKAKLNTAQQAAEIAAEIIGFQNGVVDNAEIYDARATGGTYAPLFQPETYKPRKAYYSLKAFGELRTLGKSVAIPELPEGVYAAAATDGEGNAALLIANISGETWKNDMVYGNYRVAEALIIDTDHTFETVPFRKKVAGNTVLLLRLRRK